MPVILPRLRQPQVGEGVGQVLDLGALVVGYVVVVNVVVQDTDQRRVEGKARITAIQHLVGCAAHGQQLNLHNIIKEAATIGEATGIAPQHTQTARRW